MLEREMMFCLEGQFMTCVYVHLALLAVMSSNSFLHIMSSEVMHTCQLFFT